MNDRDQDLRVDDALFDRIVDGGMTTEELRSAIRALECAPDGWKRCATAFLEAQFLRESLRAFGRSQEGEARSQNGLLQLGMANHSPRHRWIRHAAAAGIVAASFAIGWIAHGARSAAPAREWVSEQPVTTTIGPAHELAVSESSSRSNDLQPEDRPLFRGDRDEQAPEPPDRAIRAVARIRLGGGGSQAEVPVLAGPGITEEWLSRQPPPVSEHGQVVLERHGYQVDQRRQFLTATLADGRRVAVPVDHVRIEYTGNEPL
jgi:hypothetical protein